VADFHRALPFRTSISASWSGVSLFAVGFDDDFDRFFSAHHQLETAGDILKR
jgi:hypothetical protein